MQRRSLICVFIFTTYCLLNSIAASAQVTDSTKKSGSDSLQKAQTDTVPHGISIDPDLVALATGKTPPREYIIAGIKISGTKYLDESLLTSISGLTVGDKVTIPGGDNFSKAITNLWKQNLFSNIEINYTKIVGNNIYIEINVTERPRLSNF